ncbi:MAG: GNAT family N-acetyltransferase [Pseudomonadales bacterium]|jgi:tRNA(Met) cytidine acetyltransferase|nr:GNAT family N-acetyltransferase [Pseudomonadales bacterium]
MTAPAPRQATLLAGPRPAILRAALAGRPPGADTLWIGGPHHDAPHANRIVGRELRAVVVDPRDGVDANRLGAALGAVGSGGELLWLDVPADPPRPSIDRFRRLLLAAARRDGTVRVSTPEQWRPAARPLANSLSDPAEPCSEAQQEAVAAIRATLLEAPGILALRADRGRGKSAALGLAAADALAALPPDARIAVTAAQPSGSATLLAHARARCERLGVDAGRLRFVDPEALGAGRALPSRLIVDEAATLGGPELLRLARDVEHLVLATTEHGYEGTGQAFRLRLLPALEALGERPLRQQRLFTPLRWPPGDPLERLAAQLLLLDAEAARPAAADRAAGRVSAETLAGDEQRLAAVYGLLREAHYQTRPADLLRMLDDAAVSVWQAGADHAPAACALTIEEGGLSRELASAMVRGERRPRGQLGAGILAERLGFEAGARLRSVRIQRIAVHASLRRRGIGARLIATLRSEAAARGVDLLTSSFGDSAETRRFWGACGFVPLRLGERAERASGRRALFVAAGISDAGHALVREAAAHFRPPQESGR